MPRKNKVKQGKKNKSSKKPPQKIIVFQSGDKLDHEKWEDNPGRSIANFIRPYRCCNLAGVNCGKTSLTKNMIIHADPPFDRIVLIHLDPDTLEYDDIDFDDGDKLGEIPDVDFFDPPADDEDENEDDPEEKDPYYTLCIIEDLNFSQNKHDKEQISKLFRYISTHRNVSVILNFQNYTDIPPIVRRLCNIHNVYEMTDLVQCEIVARRLGMKKGILPDMIDQLLDTRYDFLTFDNTTGTPYPRRKNLFQPINTHKIKDFDPNLHKKKKNEEDNEVTDFVDSKEDDEE